MKLFFFLFLVCLSNILFAQKDSMQFNPLIDTVAEKLVELAIKNVRVSAAKNNSKTAEYELKRSRTAWLNNIAVAGNLNEFSISQSATADPLKQSTQFPRYNIGLVLPLGIFINNPKQTKASLHAYKNSVDQVKMEEQSIRKEVLILYEDYVLNKQLLSLQQASVQDYTVLVIKQEEKFSNNEISIDEYTASNKQLNLEKVRLYSIIRDLKVGVAELEALIGVNVETAIGQIRKGQPVVTK